MKRIKLLVLSFLSLMVVLSVSGCGMQYLHYQKSAIPGGGFFYKIKYDYSNGICYSPNECDVLETQVTWKTWNDINANISKLKNSHQTNPKIIKLINKFIRTATTQLTAFIKPYKYGTMNAKLPSCYKHRNGTIYPSAQCVNKQKPVIPFANDRVLKKLELIRAKFETIAIESNGNANSIDKNMSRIIDDYNIFVNDYGWFLRITERGYWNNPFYECGPGYVSQECDDNWNGIPEQYETGGVGGN